VNAFLQHNVLPVTNMIGILPPQQVLPVTNMIGILQVWLLLHLGAADKFRLSKVVMKVVSSGTIIHRLCFGLPSLTPIRVFCFQGCGFTLGALLCII
jgi:hypothetical protein